MNIELCWLYDCVFQISQINRKFLLRMKHQRFQWIWWVCHWVRVPSQPNSPFLRALPFSLTRMNATVLPWSFYPGPGTERVRISFLFRLIRMREIVKKNHPTAQHANVWIDWNNSNCAAYNKWYKICYNLFDLCFMAFSYPKYTYCMHCTTRDQLDSAEREKNCTRHKNTFKRCDGTSGTKDKIKKRFWTCTK